MILLENKTKQYTNQYYDVKDDPRMKGNEAVRTCNVSCVSMITIENVNSVLNKFLIRWGFNKKYQWERNLISYLEKSGHECKAVTKLAWPIARKIKDEELKIIIGEIKKGRVIFFHKKGHYQLLTGFVVHEGKTIDDTGSLSFIFNDPAGDRRLPISARLRESGEGVIYPYSMVKSEKIYGRCWSVKL